MINTLITYLKTASLWTESTPALEKDRVLNRTPSISVLRQKETREGKSHDNTLFSNYHKFKLVLQTGSFSDLALYDTELMSAIINFNTNTRTAEIEELEPDKSPTKMKFQNNYVVNVMELKEY